MPTIIESQGILQSKSIEYYDAVQITLGTPTGDKTYRMSQAPFDILYGNPFKAAGGLLSISEITQNASFGIDKINISLAGIVPLDSQSGPYDPPGEPIMIQAQQIEYIDKPVSIVRLFFKNNELVDGEMIFKGYIDVMNVNYAPGNGTQVSLDISSHWTNFDRVSTRYTNNTSQQEYFPGDVGLEYSVEIQKEITWREPE